MKSSFPLSTIILPSAQIITKSDGFWISRWLPYNFKTSTLGLILDGTFRPADMKNKKISMLTLFSSSSPTLLPDL